MIESPRENQKIVVMGGGTGQFHLLRGLIRANNPEFITAMPGSWDNGGSSGKLRTELGILPVGDSRRCLVGLHENEDWVLETLRLSDDRFNDVVGPLKGHDFINLEIQRLTHIHGGSQAGIDAFRRRNGIRGRVIPTSLMSLNLLTKPASGADIVGEAMLDERGWLEDYDPEDPENRILAQTFNTQAEANPLAIEAINEADRIIFAPGSFWGSIMPHLGIKDIRQAIVESSATVTLFLNLMTERGQTDNLSASEHLETFLQKLGNADRLNYLVVNNDGIPDKILEYYAKFHQTPVMIDEEACLKLAPNLKVLEVSLASYSEDNEYLLRHDPTFSARICLNPEMYYRTQNLLTLPIADPV